MIEGYQDAVDAIGKLCRLHGVMVEVKAICECISRFNIIIKALTTTIAIYHWIANSKDPGHFSNRSAGKR